MKKLYIIILSIIANFSFAYSQNLFIPNWGQWNDNIMFSTENHSLYFTQNAIFNQYSFRKDSSNISLIIKTSFPGSNNINVCGADSFAYFNFLYVNNNRAVTHVPAYKSVKIKNIYNNIDLTYYFDNNKTRYDFIVNPNADPSDIKLKIEGTDKILLNEKGECFKK